MSNHALSSDFRDRMNDRISGVRALSHLLCIALENDAVFSDGEAYGLHVTFSLIADDMDEAIEAECGNAAEVSNRAAPARVVRHGITLGDLTRYGSREAYDCAKAERESMKDRANKADEFMDTVDTAAIAKRANLKKEAVEHVMGLLREASRQSLADPETDVAKAAKA